LKKKIEFEDDENQNEDDDEDEDENEENEDDDEDDENNEMYSAFLSHLLGSGNVSFGIQRGNGTSVETNGTNNNNNSLNFLRDMFQMIARQANMEDVKVVCSEDELKKLKVMPYSDVKKQIYHKISQCNVCLDEYEDSNELMILECEHYFHKACLIPWLEKNSNKCPICRKAASKGTVLES